MVELKTTTSFTVAKGPNFQSKFVKAVADLTKDMVDSNAWKRTTFKKYNFKSLGSNVGGGELHPLMKVRTEFRKILLQMGFEEMQQESNQNYMITAAYCAEMSKARVKGFSVFAPLVSLKKNNFLEFF